jgi:hypothetical protein
MSASNSKYLLVFNYTQDTPVNLLQQIKICKAAMLQREDAHRLNAYILYVTPKIPNFALCTPQMIKQFYEETNHAQIILNRLGEILNIPESHRFLRAGISDWQAKLLARELSIECIIGLSDTFQKIISWTDKIAKYIPIQNLFTKIVENMRS